MTAGEPLLAQVEPQASKTALETVESAKQRGTRHCCRCHSDSGGWSRQANRPRCEFCAACPWGARERDTQPAYRIEAEIAWVQYLVEIWIIRSVH
jgi:hypothetical protein